jgi:hypothetical protein
MHVSYGPPGHKGVTQIMGLGDSASYGGKSLVPSDKPSRTVGVLAALATVTGLAMGSSTVRNIGVGGVLAILYVQMLQPSPKPPAPPESVQGWG